MVPPEPAQASNLNQQQDQEWTMQAELARALELAKDARMDWFNKLGSTSEYHNKFSIKRGSLGKNSQESHLARSFSPKKRLMHLN